MRSEKPWEQLEGESSEAYARFLVYRNLGPSRSIEKAFRSIPKSSKKLHTSGKWKNDSSAYAWVERSHAWDIENLLTVGQRTVTAWASAVELMALRSVEALQLGEIKPKDWKSLVEAINILGNFIPAETVAQIRDMANSGEIAPIGRDSVGKPQG